MRIFLNDQRQHYKKHLESLKTLPVIPYNKKDLRHKISQQLIQVNPTSSFDFLFNYKIFPSNILNSYSQWTDENRFMQVGDTIVQQIYLPPSPYVSQKIITGVRIKEVFNSDNCKGFSYETLNGHVEKGNSTFKIEIQKDKTLFTIETSSAPNGFFLTLFGLFSSIYQDYCTKEAMQYVKRKILIPFPS